MNLRVALVMPWRLMPRSQNWLMLVLFLLCIATAIALGRTVNNAHWWLLSTGLYCVALFFPWAFHIPFLLPVAATARDLRLRGVAQAAANSVGLYAALCIAAPVIVLTPLGANGFAVALASALTIAASLAFALLPLYILLFGWLVLILGQTAAQHAHIHLPIMSGHAALMTLGWPTLIVLAAIDVWRWHTLSHGDERAQRGFRSALVLRRDPSRVLFGWVRPAGRDSTRIRKIPDWAQVHADLNQVDPAHPVRAIRIGLGRWAMPLTWHSRLRQWLFGALALTFALLVWLITSSGNDAPPWLHSAWFWILMAGYVAIAVPGSWLMRVYQRWGQSDPGLSLLALLPGLGNAAEQKRRVLAATLAWPLLWLCAALLVGWIGVAVLHASPLIGLYALLLVLGMGSLLCAGVLGSLGGKPVGGATAITLIVVLLLLAGVVPSSGHWPDASLSQSMPAVASLHELFAVCWLAWLCIVAALGFRGWRALQKRPHPFLANTQ